jgi:NADPH:quinone reductase-like Zn-dependent oxidoreductase
MSLGGRAYLAGRKPNSIGFAEAAALPLTSITAWEFLFDRIGVREGESGASARRRCGFH